MSDSPSHAKDYRLHRGTRVLLLGLSLSAILMALVISLFLKLGAGIALDTSERDGLAHLLPLNQLISLLQQHRGMSTSPSYGQDKLSVQRTQLQGEIVQSFKSIASHIDPQLADHPEWRQANQAWQDIMRDGDEWTRIENFNRHTRTIARLLELMRAETDVHNLSVDRALDTYYLQELLTSSLPELQEKLAQLRGYGAFAIARKSLPEQVRFTLLKDIDDIETALHKHALDIQKIGMVAPSLENRLQAAQDELSARVDAIVRVVREDVLTARFQTKADVFFEAITREIDASSALMATVYAPALEERLTERINDARQQLVLIGLVTLLAFVVIGLLIRQVMLSNQDLSRSVERLDEENRRRKASEEDLRIAVELAERANRAKTEFLANLTHEIRTPLNGVLGSAELLEVSNPDAEQSDLIQALQSSGKTLCTMLDRLLDYSHIESGQVTLLAEPIHLTELLEMTVYSARRAADAKGLLIQHHFADDLPPVLIGDSHRLKQVIVELLDNAVKFTAAGQIMLSASAAPAARDDQVILNVDIADTGIGVPAEMHEAIFISFVQVDGSVTRKVGGNGLGLSIARALVLLMGGSISFEARVDGGSTFRISIPMTRFDALPKFSA